jgi:heme/copper-type cytochrome/quinol oxidase subunit 2
MLFKYLWAGFYLVSLGLSVYSLIKVNYMAKIKNYTPQQRKRYIISWLVITIVFIVMTLEAILKLFGINLFN